MDRCQAGGTWRLKVKVHGRGVEADEVELRFGGVELRDANERRIEIGTPGPIRLAPVGFGTPEEQWVDIPPSAPSTAGVAQVRRLRIAGTVYATRRRRLGRSKPFDLDMRLWGSLRGEQINSEPETPLLGTVSSG